ncbi:MAG: phospholipase D-like domain-containing protein [Chloroflexi bacterium]|nr:phospholipase D-like domain-containing protein [Chloroflexota bacterium]
MAQKSRKSRSSTAQTTLGSALALLILAIAAFLFRSVAGGDTPATPPPIDDPAGKWISVYFTDPTGPNADAQRGGPDMAAAEAIDAALRTVDIAAYDLDLWSIRDALLDAHQRGVKVRVVTDSDYIDNPEVQELMDAGIRVLGDRREGLMHDKFIVIDRQEVWCGSMNFTLNDAYKNNNNLLRIRSTRLAENYTTEFEEMFVRDEFGPTSTADTPYPALNIEGTQLEVYFSPDDGVAARLVELIAAADQSVYFLAFSFTSDDIGEAMRERARGGVTVAGVMEEGQVASNRGDEYRKLRTAGADVRLDGNPRNMHHKVIILDEQIVIVGSYNFSASAENQNDENLIVIYNVELAALYLNEFQKVFSLAQN